MNKINFQDLPTGRHPATPLYLQPGSWHLTVREGPAKATVTVIDADDGKSIATINGNGAADFFGGFNALVEVEGSHPQRTDGPENKLVPAPGPCVTLQKR